MEPKGVEQSVKENEPRNNSIGVLQTPERHQAIYNADNQVSSLISTGQQRIDKIEQAIDLPAEDTIVVRKEIGLFERLEKITDEARVLLGKFKEKFPDSTAEAKDSDTTTEESESYEKSRYNKLREYLIHEQKEISRPVIEEARRKRDQLLETRGLLLMPEADFDTYFSDKEYKARSELKQQNVGDCYLVAAIHAMSRSPHFEMICRSSMRRLPDGSWQVRVPLLSENRQMITITPEELLPQKNKQFLKRDKELGTFLDIRRKLSPAKGKEGLKVLEAAFIKAKFGSVDRLAAEGGHGDDALLTLGGENFERYRVVSDIWNPEKRKFELQSLSNLDEESMAYLDHYLENFDPEIHMATVSSRFDIGKIAGFYKAKGTLKFLVPQHAYSISSVDIEKKIIYLANPWDTSRPISFTFDQFKENFTALRAIRINSAIILRSMKKVEEKVA